MLDDNNLLAFLSKIGTPMAMPGLDTRRLDDVSQQQIDNPSTVDPLMEQRINEMFNLKHDAADRLSQYSMHQPTREQFAPGMTRKIGAFLANLGSGGPAGVVDGTPVGYIGNPGKGYQVQQGILNDPYNKAVDDYQLKLKPLDEAAQAESRLNTANRQLGTTLLTNERMIRSNESLAKRREHQNTTDDAKVEISRQRALAYQWKTTHPDYKSFIDNDGMVVFVNPKDPTDIQHTGLDSGKLSDADKLALQIEGRLKVANVQAGHQSDLEDQKQGNRKELEGVKYPEGRPQKSTTAKPQTPAAENRALINKANQLVSQHPEWKKYYEISAQGVKVKPSGLFRGNEAERDQAYKALYGNSPNTPIVNHDVEKVKVEKDGKQYMLPKSQLESAKAQGYKEAK